MKFSALTFLFFILLSMTTSAEPFAKTDPLIGQWHWVTDITTFNADGTCICGSHWKGTWTFIDNPAPQRKYVLVWNRGESIDVIILAENRQTIQLQPLDKNKLTFSRAGATPHLDSPPSSFFGTH